ncbi:Hypothetical Protein FCC1311_068592 [Hondaea fermentalgiana]|uniref:Uncharacterized protein n=1 Tax=Hondaea fermentalgiana TaxID=2315210 RepID=A0A2R5GJZ1_9STRA|nr:Hypothetical Protein FCC1311_068592 [Hondaea fermentalgiana]|eukprot:GBG30639.1 Hypothetical Protein FCC1311_068592 [Hondaea fermentalgiana]
MGYWRNLKWQLAVLLGHEDLLKKKKLRAKRTRVALDDEERELEKGYSYTYVDRNVRRKLRLWLSRSEMDAIALLFDQVSQEYPGERLSRIEFLHMIMQSGGPREEPLSKNDVDDILRLFEHAKVVHRREYVVPGKQHPYIAERYKKRRWYRFKRAVLGNRYVQAMKTVPSDLVEDPEEQKARAREKDSIDLHELLLTFSFWKRIYVAGEVLDGMDDVSFFFFLFEAGARLRLTEAEFAMAMRVVLEAVYISDYEDPVGVPVDCDPDEYERQKKKEEVIADLEELDRNFLKDFAAIEADRKKRNLVERYLDVIYDDVDKAEMGTIDAEDLQEWLDENHEAGEEFVDQETGAPALEKALQAVRIKEGEPIDREHFYAFLENSHILTHELHGQLEIKLFEQSRLIAHELFDMKTIPYLRIEAFRQFLRESPDKRLAAMVVRVSRAVRKEYQSISPRAREALVKVLRYQSSKPKFDPIEDEAEALKQRKRLQSPALTALRKEYADRSPLERLRLEPLSRKIETEVASAYSAVSTIQSEFNSVVSSTSSVNR